MTIINKTTANGFTLHPGNSRIFTYAIIGVYLLTIFALVIMSISNPLKILLLLAISTNVLLILQQHVFWQQAYTLRYSENFAWQLAYRDNDFVSITILDNTVATSVLLIVHFLPENGKKQALLVFKDTLPAEQYRQLRAGLKISSIDTPI